MQTNGLASLVVGEGGLAVVILTGALCPCKETVPACMEIVMATKRIDVSGPPIPAFVRFTNAAGTIVQAPAGTITWSGTPNVSVTPSDSMAPAVDYVGSETEPVVTAGTLSAVFTPENSTIPPFERSVDLEFFIEGQGGDVPVDMQIVFSQDETGAGNSGLSNRTLRDGRMLDSEGRVINGRHDHSHGSQDGYGRQSISDADRNRYVPGARANGFRRGEVEYRGVPGRSGYDNPFNRDTQTAKWGAWNRANPGRREQ